MNILIIGGTGTLSKTVTIMSLEKEHSVTVLNRGSRNDILPKNINHIICDFYNKKQMIKVLHNKKFDIIIDFLSRNKEDIQRVYPLFASISLQYIFVSSACIFNREKKDLPINELSVQHNDKWDYNVQKYEAELELKIQNKIFIHNKYTIVRPYITYDTKRIPLAITPDYIYHKTIIERILSGKAMFVIGDGSTITTVTYVSDFAKYLIKLYLNPKAFNNDFNIIGDSKYTHLDLLKLIYQKLNMEPNIIFISPDIICKYLPNYSQMIIGDRSLDAVFDNSKIKNIAPTLTFDINFEKGLDKIIEYYKQNTNSLIDYRFDAQIDYLLYKSKKINYRYINYNGIGSFWQYWLYRYIKFKYASRIEKIFRYYKIFKAQILNCKR